MLYSRQDEETETRGVPCLWSLSQTYQRFKLGSLQLVERLLLQPKPQDLKVASQPRAAGCVLCMPRFPRSSVISR
jgi:hypothetical protein